MEYLHELKAVDIETETGEAAGSFVALVSTYEVDRVGDRVVPGAFRRSLERWRRSGKQIPVLADHHGKIDSVVGRVDPRLSFETAEGLEVSGAIDTSTALGERVYQLVKDGTLSWSIGYRVPKGGCRRRSGVDELVELDLAEISAVPTPAAEGTRTVSIKSAAADPVGETWTTSFDEPRIHVEGRGVLSYNELREHMDNVARKTKVAAEIRAKTKELEEAERREEAQAAAKAQAIPRSDAPFTDDEGRHLAGCAAPDCDALATNVNGSLRFVPDRRWWCHRHRHLAGEHDHLPEEPTYVPGPNPGSVRLNPNSEKGRRVKAEAERRREEQRQRREADERSAEALAQVREAYEREAMTPILGLRVHPGNITVDGK